MPTVLSVSMIAQILSSLRPDTPLLGEVQAQLANAAGGEQFTQGQSSGQSDRVYVRGSRSLGIGATDAYNLLAAGSLKDPLGQTIDLDELKGLMLICLTGKIRLIASTGTPITLFQAAGDAINLSAGQFAMFGFGPTGLSVETNSLFEILETGGAGSTYSILFFGAN